MFNFKQGLILHPVSKTGNIWAAGQQFTRMWAIPARQKDYGPPCHQGPNILPQEAHHGNAELRITDFLKLTLEFALILQQPSNKNSHSQTLIQEKW